MSLLDSLLLDPTNIEVWIAPRADGQLGSGTEDDPYDGSVRATPQITVSNISSGGTTATVTTAVNHGFQNLQLVQISGVSAPDGAYFNSSFVISGVTSTTFNIRLWGAHTASVSAAGIYCQLDPYLFDAIMRSLPMPVSISNSGNTATVTALEHGFVAGNVIAIGGTIGSFAPFNNGVFTIVSVPNYDQFTYTMSGSPPAGQVTGSPYCRLNQFDASAWGLTAVPPVAVRLGPGTFQTKGYAPNVAASWIPRSAMKIFGAGIDVTLLRLQGAAMDNNPYGYAAISDPYDIYHDGFEASDFTIDCNIAAQPSQLVTCDAVVVNGTHNRLRRLRVINFGAQTISPIQVQCFPLYLGTYQLPINQPAVSGVADVIEDCIVEQPGLNNALETSCLSVVTGELGEIMPYGRGGVIRNCWVNCEVQGKPDSDHEHCL